MTFEVYSTRNKKSGVFGKLDMQLFTEEQAIENYSTAYLEAGKENQILFAELELYHLGTYDTLTGAIKGFDKPVFLLDLGAIDHGESK